MAGVYPGNLYSPIRNSGVFSSHWLEHHFALQPEWEQRSEEAADVLTQLDTLWKTERNRVEKYGDEQGLEHGFIQPVMKALGWKLKYQTFLDGREPDYALFLTDFDLDTALTNGRKSEDFWKPAALVADAKKWDLLLDRKVGVGGKKEYPPEQIQWYLDRSRKPFGFLTNGRVWRLIPRELGPHQRRFQTYYEVDLASILNESATPGASFEAGEDFRRFFLLFGPAGYVSQDGQKPLVVRAVEGSSEYRVGVSDRLKDNAFEALRVSIEGFLGYAPNKLSAENLDLCRENSFTLLCRLLFILYAEDRRLLPYRTNALYTANRSLARLRDEIAKRLDDAKARRGDDYRRTSTALWDDLLQLFDLIDEGSPRYGVPAYNGGLFAPEGHPFLNDKKLDDWHLARVIDNFGRTNDPKHPDLGVFRVDYRDLALQHLGGVYEGLLELHPTLAKVRTRVFSRRNKGRIEECYVPDGEPLPEGFHPTDEAFGPGSVYLVTDKRERRAFGSYYTPDHIVEHIIRQTVEPLCDRLTSDITDEIQAAKERMATDEELDALQSDFPNRLLKLRILDPSMGSGHFLLAACQYLAEQIATNPFTPPGPEATDEEDTLAFWKRRVIENCLYGVDLNPLAVDLAKLALWLETVSKDRPLTFLDPHLKEGNSLIGARLSRLAGLNGAGGMLAAMFPATFAGKLPTLLAPLAAIRDAPSDTLKSIKEKESQFGSYQKAVEPFKLLANVWTADAAGFRVDPASYATAAAKVDAPRTFKAFAAEAWFHDAASCAEKLRAFHWDLAFPEVFCDEGGPRAGGGFDAVIGNPPYEVLSELESGIDPTALKKFIESESLYTPAVRGKQNLYKLFICRAIDVLRDGGRFGFIVPMALLGDDIASDLRRGMVAAGEFEGVDAFPQKDVPSKRVFEDAKLSTAVFSFVKQRPEVEPRKFRSRVHSERDIDPTSPFLELTTAEIPLYDPDNFTVVSCSQADWDLAVRIMKMGRMKRLREYVDFFQGEVNETNEKKKGTLVQSDSGKLVIRGASICLYTSRIASQGDDLFLDVEAFLKDKGADTKAFHHRHRRVGWQESSPQNNFRRIIAALIPAGEFFNHTVNYLTEFHAKVPLSFVVGLLNSTLADWYFRLGSTNAHVSHYQLYNLPCPIFREKATTEELAMGKLVAKRLNADEPHRALLELDPLFETAPFSPVVRDAIVAAVEKIIAIETDRGEIARAARSALAPAAQPFQDFIDECFFRLAGLTPAEVTGLKQRYQAMKKVK